jgi:hypothetical protein
MPPQQSYKPQSSSVIYQVSGVEVARESSELQSHLKAAYAAGGRHARPRCMCVPEGVEMYISRVAGHYLVKRMPGGGRHHDPMCGAYEPPAEVSGLGQVMGTAITEDPVEDTTVLKLDFSLSRVGRRAPVETDSEPSDSVKSSGSKLSLRGLLHYLWTEAEFNRWTPGMEGKRDWNVLRYHLLAAAERKEAKGHLLRESLYLPEVWREGQREEISKRRRAVFLRKASSKGRKELMLLLAEVEAFDIGRYDYTLKIKHAPDCAFVVPEDLAKALGKRFALEIALFKEAQKANDEGADARDPRRGHLIVFGTFSIDMVGAPHMEELTLMFVNRNWLPAEDIFEIELLEQLMTRHRFVKGLRVNMPASRPLATAVVPDAEGGPTALYVVRSGVGEEYERVLEELISKSDLTAWIWRLEQGDMPALPAPGARRVSGYRSKAQGSAARSAKRVEDGPAA